MDKYEPFTAVKYEAEVTEHRLSCLAYGITFRQESSGFFAYHNVAGVLGPFRDFSEAIEVSYNTWVRT